MHIFEVIFDNTGFGDIGLQAAMVAASTETSLGGHRCIAKLARPSKRPAIEIAIDHDTKADAPSNRHHQEMLIWQTPTEEFLIDRQAIDIIIKKDRNPQAVFQGSADLHVLPVRYP